MFRFRGKADMNLSPQEKLEALKRIGKMPREKYEDWYWKWKSKKPF